LCLDAHRHRECFKIFGLTTEREKSLNMIIMTKKLYLALLLGASLASPFKANAIPISIQNEGTGTDDPFSSVGGNPVSVFGWLDGEILSWNNHNLTPHLPEPTTALSIWTDLNGVSPTISVAAGDYIAIHYGTGPGGTDSGGGLVAYYFTAGQQYTPAASGSGPNGKGGISFVYLWDHGTVPDGGSTAVLLGAALTGLTLIRRKLACWN
jgi:hypothetical protein